MNWMALTVAAALSGTALGDALYSQDPEVAALGGGYFTDAVPGQSYNQRVADDFTPTTSGDVTALMFYGMSEGVNSPEPLNVSAVEVNFYADNAGVPGAVVWSQQFAVGATNPVLLGATPAGIPVYTHTVTIAPALPIVSGVTMWFSVGALLNNPQGDAYAWQFSENSFNNSAAFDHFDGQGYATATARDVAFTLLPEPASAISAVLLLSALRRR